MSGVAGLAVWRVLRLRLAKARAFAQDDEFVVVRKKAVCEEFRVTSYELPVSSYQL
jgi:hypothetical protein